MQTFREDHGPQASAPVRPAGGFWRRHADKIGAGGSLVAAACCLGFPAALSVLSAIGLGFLINDAILLPMLVVFLVVAIFGLWQGRRRHGRLAPLILGTVSAVGLLIFTFVLYFQPLAITGIVGIVIATGLNVWLLRHNSTHACDA